MQYTSATRKKMRGVSLEDLRWRLLSFLIVPVDADKGTLIGQILGFAGQLCRSISVSGRLDELNETANHQFVLVVADTWRNILT